MLSHVPYTLGLLATAGAALAAFPRIWQAIRWTYRLIKRIDQLSHLGPVIIGMAQQFQRNGGSSMRDDVAKLQNDVTSLKKQTDEQDKILGQLREDVQRLMGGR